MTTLEELKVFAYKCFEDKTTKMSIRVACLLMYCVVRTGNFIDWLFPVRLPVTTMEDARRIWGPDVSEETLQVWVNSMNKRKEVVK